MARCCQRKQDMRHNDDSEGDQHAQFGEKLIFIESLPREVLVLDLAVLDQHSGWRAHELARCHTPTTTIAVTTWRMVTSPQIISSTTSPRISATIRSKALVFPISRLPGTHQQEPIHKGCSQSRKDQFCPVYVHELPSITSSSSFNRGTSSSWKNWKNPAWSGPIWCK
jgi:hypothetical protein